MQTFLFDTYEQMSAQAADDLAMLLQPELAPLLCIASGDTPAGMYQHLVNRAKAGTLDVGSWYFVGLDEWLGLNGSDEGSCRYHLDRQFLDPLQIGGSRLFFFDGRTADPEAECRAGEAFIATHGRIDVAILGLGLNGHIGMNEPGTPVAMRTHISTLDAITVQTGQKYFRSAQALNKGITLGLGTLLEARHIFLLVNGAKKAAIVKRLLEEPVSEALPAGWLREHPGARLYLDREAASSAYFPNPS